MSLQLVDELPLALADHGALHARLAALAPAVNERQPLRAGKTRRP